MSAPNAGPPVTWARSPAGSPFGGRLAQLLDRVVEREPGQLTAQRHHRHRGLTVRGDLDGPRLLQRAEVGRR